MIRYILTFSFLIIIFSCNSGKDTDGEISTADTSSTFPRFGISKVLDSMHTGFRSRNFKLMESFLTEDGLYLGTDPKEIWSKKQLSDYFSNNVKDTTNIDYAILSRTILLGKNNNTAMAIEQYYLNTMSEKMMVRSISRLIHKEDR